MGYIFDPDELHELSKLGLGKKNKDEAFRVIGEELERRFMTDTCDAWLAKLEAAGLPAGPILDILEMHQDPHVQAREMVPTLEHPVAGRVQTIGLPVKFARTPGRVATPAPTFGQHSREVLAEHGLDEAEIAALAADGAVVLGDESAAEAAQ